MSVRRTLLACGFVVVSAALCVGKDDPKPSPFLERVTATFSGWDRDHDGTLSRTEIDRAVTDPAVTGPDAAAAAAIKRAFRNKKYDLPPLTRDAITKMVPPPAGAKGTAPDFDALYTNCLDRIHKADRHLFTAGVPTLDAVHQGKMGDCFCLAPLGAMVARDPKAVAAMFREQPGGKVSVALGGGKDTTTIAMPTDAEIALTASTENDGLWVSVYEKAVGQCRMNKKGGTPTGLALDDVARGGSAGTMVEVVTGHAIVRVSCKPWKEPLADTATRDRTMAELRERLVSSFRDKKLVCGGTGGGIKVPGITGNHAYAVIGYDAGTDEITLWNPHGQTFIPKGKPSLDHGYPTADGKFRLPLTELVRFFGGFSFETDQPAKN